MAPDAAAAPHEEGRSSLFAGVEGRGVAVEPRVEATGAAAQLAHVGRDRLGCVDGDRRDFALIGRRDAVVVRSITRLAAAIVDDARCGRTLATTRLGG
jgi:hypothetical protein